MKFYILIFTIFFTNQIFCDTEFENQIQKIVDDATSGRVLNLNTAEQKLLRKYCYKSTSKNTEFTAKAMWALVQCEYTQFSFSHSKIDRQSVAWYVKKAHVLFNNYLKKQKINDENWSIRLILSYRYLQTANKYLPAKLDDLHIQQQVTSLLMRIFSPGSNHDINTSLITTYYNTLEKNMQKPVKQAILADSTIRTTLRTLYGRKPNKEKYHKILPPEEYELLFSDDIFKKVLDVLKTLPKSQSLDNSKLDTSITSNYKSMRDFLKIKNNQLFQKFGFEQFFGNKSRQEHIDEIHSDISKLKSQGQDKQKSFTSLFSSLEQEIKKLEDLPSEQSNHWKKLTKIWKNYKYANWHSIKSFINKLIKEEAKR